MLRITLPLLQENHGEWLQALFTGHLSPCPAFGLVGQVDILQFGSIPTVSDALLQFGCHLVEVGDGLDNRLLALLDLLVAFVLIADGGNLNLVEPSRAFLSITGDKGDGTALVEKGECVIDSPFL